MAISKQVAYKGTNVTYWKIGEVRFDYLNNYAYIRVQGYTSKEVRDDGVQDYMVGSIKQMPFGLAESDLEVCKVKEPTRGDMYTYLKTLSEFEGAVDY
jgi:hypothetical protein